jgi:ferredoxin
LLLRAQGACEGSLACSTCHVIVEDPAYYGRMQAWARAHARTHTLTLTLGATCSHAAHA